jgi:hypothetical protein
LHQANDHPDTNFPNDLGKSGEQKWAELAAEIMAVSARPTE